MSGYNNSRGHISSNDSVIPTIPTELRCGEDLFVHKTAVEGTIADGDAVEFEVGEGPKGPNATNVRKVE